MGHQNRRPTDQLHKSLKTIKRKELCYVYNKRYDLHCKNYALFSSVNITYWYPTTYQLPTLIIIHNK